MVTILGPRGDRLLAVAQHQHHRSRPLASSIGGRRRGWPHARRRTGCPGLGDAHRRAPRACNAAVVPDWTTGAATAI
jgi:hypothetical protein